jgi:hypothetical protein
MPLKATNMVKEKIKFLKIYLYLEFINLAKESKLLV